MKRYISNGDWFDKGSEVYPTYPITEEMSNCIFRGIKDGEEDEEFCPIEEFTIVEDDAEKICSNCGSKDGKYSCQFGLFGGTCSIWEPRIRGDK